MQSHCGLCAALGTVFRRLMCIAPSRRGSHESYYTNIECQHGSTQPSLDPSDPNAVLIKMEEHDQFFCDSKRLSGSEVQLVAALDYRSWKTGKFLTVHKRRRRRLTTRSLHDAALLDDLHHGQVQCVLDRVWKWTFNAFTLDTATGGRSLPVLCVHLFHWYGLIDHFNLDVVRIWKFFSLVEEGYHSTNPYHNAIHATDVTQAMHCFLQEEKIRRHLTHTEILSALIGAVTHDLDHPGVNQPFLIATSNHLAALYENTSVLENHHWRSAIGCLLESHLAEQVASVRPQLEKQIASLILATDITRQQEFLSKFKNYLDEESLDMRKSEDRHFILQIALKCADISNPCRPWDISRKWSLKVCEEFFRQGDYERQLNLPVTALCDRHTTSVPKIQSGFFRFVVEPLYKEWHRFLDTPLSRNLMMYLKTNQSKWENLIQQEIAEETRTEISEAEEMPDEVGSIQKVEERRCSLLTVPNRLVDRRRHSVPLSVNGKTSQNGRRESLPDPTRKRFSPMFDEDDELSLVSSCSSLRRSSGGSNEERPVSSEALLPDVSIASMSSSTEVQKLASILHGNTSFSSNQGRLTRQQTFPPLQQPYMRPRYLSATGELRGSSSSESSGGERCLDTKPLLSKEKENVDPDVTKIIRRPIPQNLWKRRGSAPVGIPPCDVSLLSASRRGSMPSEMSVPRPQRGNSLTEEERKKRRSKKILRRRSSGGPETFRQKDSSSTRRRGSLPIDALSFTGGRNIKENMRH